MVLLTAHKGIIQGYTVSIENIVKEKHAFRVIKNFGNREIARFTGLVQNSSGQMDFCRSLIRTIGFLSVTCPGQVPVFRGVTLLTFCVQRGNSVDISEIYCINNKNLIIPELGYVF